MNSSPPPPSFSQPPLTSKGQLPITPSPTESPTDEAASEFNFGAKSKADKGKARARETYDIAEDGGRVSMYVQLFEGEFWAGQSRLLYETLAYLDRQR